MAKTILVKPIITEKAEELSENLNQYSFVVHKKYKIEKSANLPLHKIFKLYFIQNLFIFKPTTCIFVQLCNKKNILKPDLHTHTNFVGQLKISKISKQNPSKNRVKIC